MSTLITYDIKQTSPTIHSELKKQMIDVYGYAQNIFANDNKWYRLPNTTLQKENITTKQASTDFLNACKEVGAKWEKYIAVDFVNATFDNQAV